MGRIVKEHIKGSRPGTKVKLISYFAARKLSTSFSTRVRESGLEQASCVFHFSCPVFRCQSTYIDQQPVRLKDVRNNTGTYLIVFSVIFL